MAYPTILIDSNTGSDSGTSGAGPATALTGTAASTDGTGLVVTLDGSPDLSGVATDGSHAICLEDATAGKRNFGKITATDNVAKTVTVNSAFALSASGLTWGIGGRRASLTGTISKKLWDNNSAAGDAESGWILRMVDGHVEPGSSGPMTLRRNTDNTNGPITLCGEAGATTRPTLTFTNNGSGIATSGNGWTLKDFELKNSNATKTASVGIANGANGIVIQNVKIADSSNKFWKGITTGFGFKCLIRDCEIGNTQNIGIDGTVAATAFTAINNYVHHCGTHGIAFGTGGTGAGIIVYGNICYANSSDGINYSVTANWAGHIFIAHNTCDSNGSDGIENTSAGTDGQMHAVINNILSNNTGYGLKFSSGSATAAYLNAWGCTVRGNDTYNNTSGAYLPSGFGSDDAAANPSFTNAAGGDFSVGTGLKAKGYPVAGTLAVGTTSGTSSYVDPGAAQRQEPAGGGSTSMLRHPGMTGGFVG